MKHSPCRTVRCPVAPLAWKTGTSYGYRDARHRPECPLCHRNLDRTPDGTPVAGQFGFASAVPLLNQVNNMLQSRSMVDEARLPRDPRPASVGRGVICWPGASPCLKGAKTVGVGCQPGCWKAVNRLRCCCRNRKVFAGSVSRSGWIKKANALRRIVLMRQKSAGCLAAAAGALAACCRKRAARLPARSAICPPLDNHNAAPLMLSGVREGAVIKRLP